MRLVILKTIFTLTLAFVAYALPGELTSKSYDDFYGENIGGFCKVKQSKEAVGSLLNNLNVFSCSQKTNTEKFCDCLSKTSSSVGLAEVGRISSKVFQEMSDLYAEDLYTREKEERELARLTNLYKLKEISNTQLTNCVNDPKKKTNNPSLDKLLLAQDQLIAEHALVPDVFGSVTSLNDIFEVAEDVFVKTMGLTTTMSPSREDPLDKYILQAINRRLQKNNGYFYSMDPNTTALNRSGVVSDHNIQEYKKVIKQFFKELGSYGNAGMNLELMRESIRNHVDNECRDLSQASAETFESSKMSDEERELYYGKGKTEAFRELKADPDAFIKKIKKIRDTEIAKINKDDDFKILEESYLYDVAYCSIQGSFIASVEEVAQTVKTEGEELSTEISEIIEQEDYVLELANKSTDLANEARYLGESLKNGIVGDELNEKREELAVVQEKIRVTSKLYSSEQRKLEQRTLKMHERLGGQDNYHVYRSAVATSENGRPVAYEFKDGKIIIKSEKEYAAETNAFFDKEYKRISSGKIYQAHKIEARNIVMSKLREEKKELLELNSAISDGEFSRLNSLKEPKLNKKINSLVSNSNIEKNLKSIKKKYAKDDHAKNEVKKSIKEKIVSNSNFERVVNTLSNKKPYKQSKTQSSTQTFRPSRADRAIDKIVRNPVKSEERLNSLANEIQEKEKRLAKTLAPLKENLEKVTKDSKAIESEISDIEELIKNNKSKKKESVSTSAPSRDVRQRRRTPRKQSMVEAPTSQTQTTFSGSTPSDQSVIEPEYSTDDSRVSLFKEELHSGVKVITLNEFKNASNSDLSTKPGVEDLGKTFIVDSAGVQVLFKTIYKDGKAIGYEMVETVSKDGLAKSLVSDKVEILDLKQELYKYSDFIKKLNSIPIE